MQRGACREINETFRKGPKARGQALQMRQSPQLGLAKSARAGKSAAMTDTDLQTAAQTSKAWPFEEARKLLKRYPQGKEGAVLFETGYGPSGLPHIGTFQEVLRTTLVRRAYEVLTGKPTRLVAFSDDMDGLRKVPDNVPN